MENNNTPGTSKPVEVPELSTFAALKEFIEKHFTESGTGIFYLDYDVLFADYDGTNLKFFAETEINPVFIQKCRVFNNNKELYLWRRDIGIFECRIKEDFLEQQNEEEMDTKPFLLGKVESLNNNFAVLHEDRGSCFAIPVSSADIDDKFQLKVRYYIDYHTETFQAGFVDMRFVSIDRVE